MSSLILKKLINTSVKDVYPYHEHTMGDCFCNIYGDSARNIILNNEKYNPIIKFLFVLKFKMLYNELNLCNTVIHPEWFNTFEKNKELPDFSIPFEVKINPLKVNYFAKIQNTINIEDDKIKLYVPFNKLNYKVSRINYTREYTNDNEFELYSYESDGKYYTYELDYNSKNVIVQLKFIIQFLSNINSIDDVDIAKVDTILNDIKPTKKQNINFLSNILQKEQKLNYKAIEEIEFLINLLENNENRYEIVKEYIQKL